MTETASDTISRVQMQPWPEVMRRERVAAYLHSVYDVEIGVRSLERWPIRHAKVGRVALYKREDVDRFIRDRLDGGLVRNAA